MHVVINGEEWQITNSKTISDLINELKLEGKLAIEINQEIIPRSHHDVTSLHAGDRIEIINAIGGG